MHAAAVSLSDLIKLAKSQTECTSRRLGAYILIDDKLDGADILYLAPVVVDLSVTDQSSQ